MSATVDRSVFFLQMPFNLRHFFNCKALLSYREQRGATGIFMDFHRFSWIFNSPPPNTKCLLVLVPVTGPTEQKHISRSLINWPSPEKGCLSLFGFSKFDAQQIKKTQLTLLFFFEIKLTTRWFKPRSFHPQTLEVTNNLWRGHVFTIPKRAPAKLPGIDILP